MTFRPHNKLLFLAATATLAFATLASSAQEKDAAAHVDARGWEQPCGTPNKPACPVHTYVLKNVTAPNDANEILVALRNILQPIVKIYMLPSQNAIVLSAPQDQQEIAARLIRELDHAHPDFRVTYTLTELDGTRRIGTQHFSMLLLSGKRSTMKQGSKVPVVTGTYNPGSSTAQEQFTYLDVGMNFDTMVEPYGDGYRLRSKVEQSSIAEEKSAVGEHDPIVRQTVMEGEYTVPAGKPVLLGSIDVSGTTRHNDIAVEVEPLP